MTDIAKNMYIDKFIKIKINSNNDIYCLKSVLVLSVVRLSH